MRAYVRQLLGRTLETVARGNTNRIVEVTTDRVLVETAGGDQNHASLSELQTLADRVYAGEEVEVEPHGRSAFHLAVLNTLPELEIGLNPRRVRLWEPSDALRAEYDELFPDEPAESAAEGRIAYRTHRVRERSAVLRRLKIESSLELSRGLACEVCGLDFAERYGPIGEGFIECHHTTALADSGERETTLEDLALICSNCHRMIHRSRPMMRVQQLVEALQRCPQGQAT
jgi:hypothetical protein